jgi:hypothetical protein
VFANADALPRGALALVSLSLSLSLSPAAVLRSPAREEALMRRISVLMVALAAAAFLANFGGGGGP